MTIRLVRLGNELKLERFPVAVSPDREYVQIGIRSFGRGIFHREKMPGSELSKLRYFEVTPGRLIVSNIMAWEGAIGVSTDRDRDCIASSRFLSYAPSSLVDVNYLNYYFQSDEGRRTIRSTSTGTVLRNQTLSIKDFENLVVPLPDVQEQRRIAARLDEALTKLTQVDQLREHRTRVCSALAESVIAKAIEQSTEPLKLGSALISARTPIDIDPNKDYQAFGMRSFGRGTIRYPPSKGSNLSKLRYFKFPSDTLALSNIKAWEGAIGVANDEDTACVASNRFLFYSPTDQRVNINYLKHYLLSRQGLAQISACSPGSADRNRTLSIKKFEQLEVPLPAREIQDQVVRVLDSAADHIRPGKAEEIQAALRTSLLNAAFNGQI